MPKLQSINWDEVEQSTNISATFFDKPSGTICVKFNNGSLYSYVGADQEIYTNFIYAPSLGKYLHNVIKAFPYTRWSTESELLDHLNVHV